MKVIEERKRYRGVDNEERGRPKVKRHTHRSGARPRWMGVNFSLHRTRANAVRDGDPSPTLVYLLADGNIESGNIKTAF